MSWQIENDEELPERQITPEEFLAAQKKSIRKKAFWGIGIGAFLIVAHLLLFSLIIFSDQFENLLTWKDLFKSIFFILGLFFFAAGIWGIRYAKNLTLGDMTPSAEAVEFISAGQTIKPYYSYVLIVCIVGVTLCEAVSGFEKSVHIAGFDKPAFLINGEYWRILTGGALHGSILHIYFNAQALYGFGSLIESLSNRAHLAIVFVAAVIGGGLASLFFMPEGTSVGASGGIMGLIGYLAIYGYRRKQQLPPDFLKSMLINIGFIAAFGVIAYQIIDNFAHLGGLLTGAVYGFAQVPRDPHKNARAAGKITEILGLIALAVFIFTAVLSVLLILEKIRL